MSDSNDNLELQLGLFVQAVIHLLRTGEGIAVKDLETGEMYLAYREVDASDDHQVILMLSPMADVEGPNVSEMQSGDRCWMHASAEAAYLAEEAEHRNPEIPNIPDPKGPKIIH